MTENERREREAFEAWARLENHDLRRWPAPDGTYADSLTGFMWDAWQARASLRASPAVPVAQDERELPPLPQGYMVMMSPDPNATPAVWYDEQDMRDYARAALSAATPPAAVPMSQKTQDGHSASGDLLGSYGAWRPISTAPKTPRGEAAVAVILGFAPDEDGFSPSTCEGFWNPPLQRWVSTNDPTWEQSPQPTHWMPLPDAPSRRSAAEAQKPNEHESGAAMGTQPADKENGK